MSNRLIVTHQFPDVDALMSVWLIRRFGGGHWEEAEVKFVPHGSSLDDLPESYEEVVHVDTGGGDFDHHSSNEDTCAAEKVWRYLRREDEAVERMVAYAKAVDHFADVNWYEPLSDVYDFGLNEMMEGVASRTVSEGQSRDEVVAEWAMQAMDGVYESLKWKLKAIEQIGAFGAELNTSYGLALAIQSFNDEIIRIGLKMGYMVVLRRDPLKKYVRIKAHPQSSVDLTYLYQKLKAHDPEATWYLHADKKQLLNGSSNQADRVITELEFEELKELLSSI